MLIDILLPSPSIIYSIVTRHGQSFKVPPPYETCTREASAAPAALSSSAIRKLEQASPCNDGIANQISAPEYINCYCS